ncbi:CHAT domain-containing protein [Streptomyces sp. NPDC029004]|uniref:CHAT domain-containing protein n=1 Tax=Streptomyces sp. NPDC029004 TaxID=3154490 RepID=UPI0034114A05
MSDDLAALEAEIARLRERAAVLQPGGQDRWNTEADIAELLLLHAMETVDLLPAPTGELPHGLVQSRALLDRLRAGHRTGTASYHWACLLAARCAQFETDLTGDPDMLDTAIELFETAIAPLPPHGHAVFPPLVGEAEWWPSGAAVNARCDLALARFNRSRSLPGERRSGDLDRIIALLTPAVDGPEAGLVHDAELALACLGLALADRSRAPGPPTAARSADRGRAITRLGAARAAASDAGPLPEVTFQLALLQFLQHDDGCDLTGGSGDHGARSRSAHELGPVLDMLVPLTRDPSTDGGDASDLAVMVARHLYEHDGARAAEEALIAWHRRAIDHPGTTRRQVRANRVDLALLLIDRAERNTTAPTPGNPAPHSDLGEAAEHLDLALDGLALRSGPGQRPETGEPPETDEERAEERLNILLALVTVLSMLLPGSTDDARLDRLVRRGQELIDVIPDADNDRGDACLRLALALFERTHRRALPHLHELLRRAMTPGRTDPEIALAAGAPGVREDNELTISLLRTGVGLYGYEDDLYEAAACALAISLLIGYAIRLPVRDRALIQESVRWFRIVLERAHEGGDSFAPDPDFDVLFIGALANSIWTSDPFDPAHFASWGEPSRGPDISRHPSVEDDLQTLRHLLETSAKRREQPVPVYELLLLLVTFVRSRGDLDDGACRHWRDRLHRASAHTDRTEQPLKGFLLMAAGALGHELGRRGLADPAEIASADRLLREGLRYMPPDSDVAQWAERLRPAGYAGLLQGLLGAFTGDAGGAGRGVAHSEDASVRAQAHRRTPDPAPAPMPAPMSASVPDAEPEDIPLSAAAVLPGDGSGYPFTEPVGRIIEIVTQPARRGSQDDGQRPAAVIAVHALALHRRWLHESGTSDLTDAIALTQQAIATLDGSDRPLADRLAMLLAGMLLDRHLLLGDRMDLAAAREVYARLRECSDPRDAHPELVTLLALPAAGLAVGQPDLGALLRPGRPAPPGTFAAELLAASGLVGLLAARRDGSTDQAAPPGDEADRAVRALAEAASALPADHPLLPAVISESGLFLATRAAHDGDVTALRAAVEDVVRAASLCSPSSAHRAPLLLRAAAVLCAHSHALDGRGPAAATSPARTSLDRGIDLLAAAVDEAGQGFHGARARCRYGLGRLLLARFRRTHDKADLQRAVGLLQDVRTAVHSRPGDPFTVLLTRALAEALRAYGPRDTDRREQSREAAKSVLAAHGRAVLLQTGTEAALDSARAAGTDMMRLVDWCLTDGCTEAALDALELGRGLVQNAATVAATVPELLEQAGRAELAEEWRRADHGRTPGTPSGAPFAVPDGLRLRVLQALEGGPAERFIHSAPTPSEIGRALRAVRADALVHLIPGADGTGDALVVTATGRVERVRLPGLSVPDDGPAAAYGEALLEFSAATREPGVIPAENDPPVMWELHRRSRKRVRRASDRWRKALDPLCSWAGEVAMTPLIEHFRSSRPHRLPRLVLSPVGMLGVVPWHAARLPDGPGGPVYACQEAVISYCSTLRQLVDVAARSRLPWDGTQVVVADPGGTRVMHDEARLIAAHYPKATVVGPVDDVPEPAGPGTRPPSRAATAAAVGPFLPGRGGSSAAVCHINCHATARATPAGSSLDLHPAATPPQALTIAEIQALAHGRDARAPGGLLVLANCTSDLTLADYDEALTLSTAFLTAGAASVVGSLWAISDDVRTSLVMYMFHHYLTGGGLPAHPETAGSPADALRAAQLWMLDPNRIVPPALAHLVKANPELPLDTPQIWAAFTHQGH